MQEEKESAGRFIYIQAETKNVVCAVDLNTMQVDKWVACISIHNGLHSSQRQHDRLKSLS